MSKLGHHQQNAGFDRIDSVRSRKKTGRNLWHLPTDGTKPYDMLEIIERIVDAPRTLNNSKKNMEKLFFVVMHGLMDGQLVLLPINESL